jgi:hypothetical protein
MLITIMIRTVSVMEKAGLIQGTTGMNVMITVFTEAGIKINIMDVAGIRIISRKIDSIQPSSDGLLIYF